MTRPLTEQQQRRLVIAHTYGITVSVARSMPSLERRGLAERYWHKEGGQRWRMWRLTAAGHRVAEQLRRKGQLGEEQDSD
jgi:DNA-binding PadR family transcriptional regulator